MLLWTWILIQLPILLTTKLPLWHLPSTTSLYLSLSLSVFLSLSFTSTHPPATSYPVPGTTTVRYYNVRILLSSSTLLRARSFVRPKNPMTSRTSSSNIRPVTQISLIGHETCNLGENSWWITKYNHPPIQLNSTQLKHPKRSFVVALFASVDRPSSTSFIWFYCSNQTHPHEPAKAHLGDV